MTPDDFEAVVAEAALSPNVHNTQPTLWRRIDARTIALLEAPDRTLPHGDPTGRDVAASHGAAAEGFILAASIRGFAVRPAPALEGEVGRLLIDDAATPDPLAPFLTRRRTYRGKFTTDRMQGALTDLTVAAPDLTLLTRAEDINHIARLNDIASLKGFRNNAFRAELLSWMRLSPRHPRWSEDGLNARAMEMSSLEATGAGIALRPGVFDILDGLGLGPVLTGEAAVVNSAAAVALLHRPAGEAPFETGRAWHRAWLEMTRLGLTAAPMTVLADDTDTAADLSAHFDLPSDRRLITVFRLGRAPDGSLPPPVRRPLKDVII